MIDGVSSFEASVFSHVLLGIHREGEPIPESVTSRLWSDPSPLHTFGPVVHSSTSTERRRMLMHGLSGGRGYFSYQWCDVLQSPDPSPPAGLVGRSTWST